MKAPGRHADELQRLQSLRHYDLLDTRPEPELDDLTALAAEICDVPISLISLIDEDRQWFKSKFGLVSYETARDTSFCGHTILEPGPFIVPDAWLDERFADNPLVTEPPHVRFYAGVPLINRDGYALGTFSVIDGVPRQLTRSQENALTVLARQAMAQIELRRQSRELAKSERLLYTIFDSEPECLKVVGRDGSLRMMNRAGLSMIEADSWAQIQGSHFQPLLVPEHRARFEDLLERVFAGDSVTLEFQIVGLKGRTRWLELHAAPLYDDEAKQVSALLGITRDITSMVVEISERKRAEELLVLDHERFQVVARATNDAVWDWNLVSNAVWWNENYQSLFGYPPEETKPTLESWSELIHPDDKDRTLRGIHRVIEDGEQAWSDEYRFRRRDGSYADIFDRGYVIHDTHDTPVRMIGAMQDITARKRAEAAAGLLTQRLMLATDAGSIGIWDWDLRTDQWYASPTYFTMLGYPPDEGFLDRKVWFERLHPEDRAGVGQKIAHVLAGGADTYDYEARMAHANGSYRWVNVVGRALELDDGGKPTRLLGVRSDVTERRQAEEHVQRLNRVYAVLSDINQVIVRERNPSAVLTAACRIAVEKGLFGMAWVCLSDGKDGSLRIAAHAGASADTLAVVDSLLGHETKGPLCTFTQRALQTGEHGVCNDITNDPQAVAWRDAALDRGYRAMASLPLNVSAKVVGAFNLYATEPDFFDASELRLLDELATDIAFALEVHERETERARFEQALGESEERFRQLADSIQEVFWMTEPATGTVLYVSPAYEVIWGQSCGNLYQSPESWFEAIHPDHRARVTEARALTPSGGAYDEEYRVVRPDGSIRWVRDRAFPVRDEAGKISRIAGVAEDVTARHEAEMERRRREEEFRSLIENTSDIITVLDEHGVIRFQSPSAERVLGYAAAEMIGRNARDFAHPDDGARAAAALWAGLKTPDTPNSVEYRYRHKNGTFRTLESIGRYMPTGDGLVVINSRDVTEHRALEEQLRHSQKMEAIGQLAGGVAHDFNNILTVIHGYGSLLLMNRDPSEETREAAQQIVQASEQAANLTRQLLAFGRRQVMQPRRLDLNEVIKGLVKMLQRLVAEDVRLHINLSPRALLTRADAGMLDQVLMNLVVNARDAMPTGGQLVIETEDRNFSEDAARLVPDARPGRYVCLRVTDTGSGISSEDLGRIFEPFFTTKDLGKGTGLGLATVFGIVKQHGGFLTVKSQVGRGTTFEIYLPAIDPSSAKVPTEAEITGARGGTETVLLVEDEPMVRRMTRAVLERAGYRVLEASNGVEALRIWAAQQSSIQLLFTDMVMPEGVSGRELVLRLHEDDPKLRVVFTSGYSPDIAGQELQLREGENFIQKPCSPQNILKTVRRCLDA